MVLIAILWAILSVSMIWERWNLLTKLSWWRSLVVVAILTFGSPAFFICDILELIYDLVVGDEEDDNTEIEINL